jgi:AraC-like DNA-binding protein
MAEAVRAQSLRGYRELVTDLGGKPTILLRKAGIEPGVLNQLAGLISFESLIDLLERSASSLGCPDFGLRLAERQDIGILGTLAIAVRHSPTVGEAMHCASRYIYVYNAAIAFTVTTDDLPDQARVVFRVLEKHAPQRAQMVEHGIGLAWRIINLLSEGRCPLQQVWFPHAAVGPEASYASRFDAPQTFEAEQAGLAFAASALDLPVSDQNQELHDLATRYLDVQRPRRLTVADQVRQTVEALLGTGACGSRQVANALGMHPRTLQRRLREEGTTFEEIKDETRRDLAQRYLSHRDVSLTQISALLDYSEQSALGRSCRRWFHTTPQALRARLASGAPASVVA